MTATQCSTGQLSVTANASTNQIGTSGCSYNVDGDMKSDASYAYTYDTEGRITTANGVTYTYNGDGLASRNRAGRGQVEIRGYSNEYLAASSRPGQNPSAEQSVHWRGFCSQMFPGLSKVFSK